MAGKFKNLNIEKTKETMDKILAQAKESVKVLEALQKEGLARAKSYINLPSKDMTNQKIIDGLKKMGLATRSEVRDLEKKVEELASELRSQISKLNRKSSKKDADNEANT